MPGPAGRQGLPGRRRVDRARTAATPPRTGTATTRSTAAAPSPTAATVPSTAGDRSEPSHHATAAPTRGASAKPTKQAPTEPTAPASTAPASTTPTAPSGSSGPEDQVLALVNKERAKAGCKPLTANAKLTKAARAHSEDMAAHKNMSHTGSDGSSPGDRIERAGYSWSTYGENVAYGYSSPESVMEGWMNSSGHRANILNCDFEEIGVGHAQPGHYWTQDFGTGR
ncbi:CAP domain-containing protein [Streptomyces sp. GKU 257-1]|nr:CAP domain-containing protein [Streptomyces sp. GKU 257-1]